MERKNINVGTSVNARNGDSLRDAFIKINSNFTELYQAVGILGSFADDATALITSIQGDVYGTDGNKIIDSETGKVASSAIPNDVPKIFSFRASFNADGNLIDVSDVPSSWFTTIDGNTVTVTHDVNRPPQSVVYWGFAGDTTELRLRFPTAGYQVKVPITEINSVFTLNLNSAVTGAGTGEYAIIRVLF